MGLLRWLSVVGLLGWLSGCSLAPVKSGAACQRSAQCEPGLGCVQGKCGKDLSAISKTNTVPMLGGGAGGMGAVAGMLGGASAGMSAGQAGQ